MKITFTRKTVTIKRRIIPDDRIIQLIRHNSNRRRHIWNQFVEEYRKCEENGTKIDLIRFTTAVNNNEISILKQAKEDGNDDIANFYCSDIPKSVYCDMKRSLKMLKTKKVKYGKNGTLHFKEYNHFRKSFKVRSKNERTEDGLYWGKVHFSDTTHFEFRASNNHVKNTFHITLKEPISDEYKPNHRHFITYAEKYSSKERYDFRHEDIDEIIFMEDLGKFYIMLVCDVTYYNYSDDLKDRMEIAGIDLGIHNPVTMHDGVGTSVFRLSDNEFKRMKWYERRCDRLKSIMDKKYQINLANALIDPDWPIFSKNYRKIQFKFRKYWRRVTNIRKNWRNKLAYAITMSYKNIVVDECNVPDNSENTEISNVVKRAYNKYNREHAIYEFTEMLKHQAIKNDCTYIIAPRYTTRTCSNCYHVNPKLDLSVRTLVCENCGYTIDRDINASINCYDSYKHKKRWVFA